MKHKCYIMEVDIVIKKKIVVVLKDDETKDVVIDVADDIFRELLCDHDYTLTEVDMLEV